MRQQQQLLSDAVDDFPKRRRGISRDLALALVGGHEPQVPVSLLTPCEIWPGVIGPRGYGRVWHEGRHWLAHRLVYTQRVGPIPDGLVLDHLCRNPSCVNPDHLEPVTDQVNILRGKTVQAALAARTHCTHGHEYTPENTYYEGSRPGKKYRRCKTCKAEVQRRYRGSVGTRLSAEEIDKILALHAEGLSQRQIAARVGRSQRAVWRVVNL